MSITRVRNSASFEANLTIKLLMLQQEFLLTSKRMWEQSAGSHVSVRIAISLMDHPEEIWQMWNVWVLQTFQNKLEYVSMHFACQSKTKWGRRLTSISQREKRALHERQLCSNMMQLQKVSYGNNYMSRVTDVYLQLWIVKQFKRSALMLKWRAGGPCITLDVFATHHQPLDTTKIIQFLQLFMFHPFETVWLKLPLPQPRRLTSISQREKRALHERQLCSNMMQLQRVSYGNNISLLFPFCSSSESWSIHLQLTTSLLCIRYNLFIIAPE